MVPTIIHSGWGTMLTGGFHLYLHYYPTFNTPTFPNQLNEGRLSAIRHTEIAKHTTISSYLSVMKKVLPLVRYLSGINCGKTSSFYCAGNNTAAKESLKTYKDNYYRDDSDDRCRENPSPFRQILSMKCRNS
jgi:hypothetical protein